MALQKVEFEGGNNNLRWRYRTFSRTNAYALFD
jgi:hypothetical protein